MTSNQINYARYNEDRRHNIATEQQFQNELAERRRSNLANESIGRTQAGAAVTSAGASWNSSLANLATSNANQRNSRTRMKEASISGYNARTQRGSAIAENTIKGIQSVAQVLGLAVGGRK